MSQSGSRKHSPRRAQIRQLLPIASLLIASQRIGCAQGCGDCSGNNEVTADERVSVGNNALSGRPSPLTSTPSPRPTAIVPEPTSSETPTASLAMTHTSTPVVSPTLTPTANPVSRFVDNLDGTVTD